MVSAHLVNKLAATVGQGRVIVVTTSVPSANVADVVARLAPRLTVSSYAPGANDETVVLPSSPVGGVELIAER